MTPEQIKEATEIWESMKPILTRWNRFFDQVKPKDLDSVEEHHALLQVAEDSLYTGFDWLQAGIVAAGGDLPEENWREENEEEARQNNCSGS